MALSRTAPTRIPPWITVIVIIGTLITVVGGLVAWLRPGTLIPAGSPLTHGVDLYGQRMAARNLALGVALIVFLAARATRPLAAVMAVIVLVEIGDTISAIVNADWAQLAGIVVAVAFAGAASHLLGAPLWRLASYRCTAQPTTSISAS